MDKVYLAPCPFCAGFAKKRIQKMTAREYIDISYRMFREDDRAWDKLVVCEENDPEKAIMMAKRWAREHPEERSDD